MTTARVATNYTASGVIPYTANPTTLSPIPQGTFVNATHLSATFLCRGCINSASFDPAWAADTPSRDVFFGYAFSQTAVAFPCDMDTRLSDHTGPGAGYGAFRVVLGDARSDDYDTYAAMAEQQPSGGASSQSGVSTALTTGAGASATATGVPAATPITGTPASATTTAATTPDQRCWESECETPSEPGYSHREMPQLEFVALVVLGVVYLVQAVLP